MKLIFCVVKTFCRIFLTLIKELNSKQIFNILSYKKDVATGGSVKAMFIMWANSARLQESSA